MKLYESDSVTVFLREENGTIVMDWKRETGNWSKDDFKNENQRIMNVLRGHKAKYLLSLSRNFLYPITPDQQLWLSDHVFKAHKKNGVRKLAVIMSDEYISQLSFEQLVDEAGIIPAALFSNEEDAQLWLRE